MQATKLWILAIMASSIAAHGVAVIADAAVDMSVSMQNKTVHIIDEIGSLYQVYVQSGVMDDADMQHLHDLVQECILRWDEFSESERNALAAIFDELAQLLEVVDATKSTRDQGNVPVLQLVINQNTERLRDLALRTLVVDNLLVTNSVTLPGSAGGCAPCNSNNVANTVVLRDSVGSFSAQNVTAEGMFELPATTATAGQLRIDGQPVLHTYGIRNNFVGQNAGNFAMTGNDNIGFGNSALFNNTTGFQNIAIGDRALLASTTGYSNVAIGQQVLTANIGGTQNVGVGRLALLSNTSGGANTALGLRACQNLTTGNFNIAIGAPALFSLTTGSSNIAIGGGAGSAYTTESNNICIGATGVAGDSSVCRIGNIYTSPVSGSFVTVDSQNRLGYDARGNLLITATSKNVVNTLVLRDSVGSFSGQNISAQGLFELPTTTATTGQLRINNSAVLHTYGATNTFVGQNAGNFTMTGGTNVGIGNSALFNNTTGSSNIAIGGGAGSAYTTESSNICIGATGVAGDNSVCRISNIYTSPVSGSFVTVDSQNRLGYDARGNLLITATSKNVVNTLVLRDSVGSFSGQNISAQGLFELPTTTATTGQLRINNSALLHTYGTNNIFLGDLSGNFTLSSNYNVAVGYRTLQSNSSGSYNTAVGAEALLFSATGSGNTAIGADAATNTASGGYNTAVGEEALRLNTSGSNNTAIGATALLFMTSGSGNTVIGSGAGSAYINSESNNICIGTTGISGDNSVCRIGNIRGKTTLVNNAIAVLVDSNNQLGTVSSSARYKTNIQDLDTQRADAILAVRPVTFNYLNKDGQPFDNSSMGLIAEEVAAINPEWVVYDEEGLPMTIRYHELIIPVIKQLQQVVQHNAQLAARLELLESLNKN